MEFFWTCAAGSPYGVKRAEPALNKMGCQHFCCCCYCSNLISKGMSVLFLCTSFGTTFLSRNPNWQRSRGPADSPEACGKRRMLCHQPKPTVLGAVVFSWGERNLSCEPSLSQFHSALKKGNREVFAQWIGRPEPQVHSTKSITWHRHAGKPGTNGSTGNRLSSPGTARVSTLGSPLTFSTDVTLS